MIRKTNADIIFAVKEQTDAHLISQNTGFSDEHILFYLLQCRSTFLYRKEKQYHVINNQNYMTTPCMKLIEAVNCPCVPPVGCMVLMTEEFVPTNITGIISVTNPDNNVEYTPTTSHLNKYRSSQRIKVFAEKVTYFEQNTGSGARLYVITDKPLKYVIATIIPDNPEEVQRMRDCTGKRPNECVSTYDLEWILDAELTKACIDETINILLRTKSKLTDVKNNAVDDNVANKQELNT